MNATDSLLALADAYGAAHKIESSTVSWRVFGDTKKLGAIREGADIQMRRFEKAVRWFSANWPAGVDWPAGIPRPETVAA